MLCQIGLFSEGVVQRMAPSRRPSGHDGNSKTVFSIIGASNHSETERHAEDYYATPPSAVEQLLDLETFSPRILEPSCGGGHISRVLEARGHQVVSCDLCDRGFGISGVDFLDPKSCASAFTEPFYGDIVGNPPYRLAQEFVERGLGVVGEGHRCAWFLKLTFLEGKSRRALFDRGCLEKVYVSSSRLGCGKNGTEWNPSAVAYAWYIFRKGYCGDPIIKWFN